MSSYVADMEDQKADTKTLCMPEPQTASPSSYQFVRNATLRVFPTPHVMVTYKGRAIAWGRTGLFLKGYKKTRKAFCETYIYNPERHGSSPGSFARKNAHKVQIRGLLHKVNGTGLDEDPVELGPIGWEQLIDNVVEIHLTYEDDK